MNRLRPTGFAVSALALASLPAVADVSRTADGFPNRPITLVVPYGAGGGSDQLARAWGAAAERAAGVPFVVVNKPGGGGMAAVPDFMSAPRDGYTVLESIDDAVTNFVSGKLREDPAADWAPICLTQITFSQLYVRADDERFPDFASLLAYTRAHPGAVTVANVGNLGSMERVNMAMLERALDFETRQIAFDNPAERYAAVLGGQVDVLFEQPGDVSAYLDAGQLKPVLTFLEDRPEAFADVPTATEAGLDAEPLLRFRGFWTHPAVAEERRDFLGTVCDEAFRSDAFQAFNAESYMHVIDSYRDADGARALINTSAETYREIYKTLGLID
ncbi:hypothetical protein DLJ53_12515 [Acuticoccus sediminis]|uniref:Tripartite-type tricarboxylate transporter receptor subunit TctC n=1 Tax=Acuticoccus sediminis TaxID=2184697 RepID=A0A8B2NWK7_9HYPH|nr:tripartite tricarboxylate transporter substrate binding protein [Acuticoccus sediminis]RAI02183.1 hypothetical protein DLJ53_12515 [Acuticoccus sediminis]